MDRYAISLINLSGTAILLCAGLSRFIFPLMSLEGRKFWILGLTPISRDQLLRGKFAFAATGSLVIAEGLILVSDLLIGLPWEGLLLHATIAAIIAIGLSALNVGLGAYMPTFKETDPSKIVVGFGGTVNMVVGLGFLVAVIGMMAVPFHTAQLTEGEQAADRGESVGLFGDSSRFDSGSSGRRASATSRSPIAAGNGVLIHAGKSGKKRMCGERSEGVTKNAGKPPPAATRR